MISDSNFELTLRVLEKFRHMVFEDLYAGSAESDFVPPEKWSVLAETSKEVKDMASFEVWARQHVVTVEVVEGDAEHDAQSVLVYAVLDELAYADEKDRDPTLVEWLKTVVPEAYDDLQNDNYLTKYERL